MTDPTYPATHENDSDPKPEDTESEKLSPSLKEALKKAFDSRSAWLTGEQAQKLEKILILLEPLLESEKKERHTIDLPLESFVIKLSNFTKDIFGFEIPKDVQKKIVQLFRKEIPQPSPQEGFGSKRRSMTNSTRSSEQGVEIHLMKPSSLTDSGPSQHHTHKPSGR